MPNLICVSTLIALFSAFIPIMAAAALDSDCVVDAHGKTIIKQQTQHIDYDRYQQLFLCYRKSVTRPTELNTVPVLIDRNGKEVSASQANYIDGLLRTIDNSPPVAHPVKSIVRPDSLRKINKDGLCGIADLAGNIVVPCLFDEIQPAFSNLIQLSKFNKETGDSDLYCFDIVSRKLSENCVRSLYRGQAQQFSDGLCAIILSHRDEEDHHLERFFQFFDANMDVAFAGKFSIASPFWHGLATIKDYPNGSLLYYIDKTGKRVSPGFSFAGAFNGEYAVASPAGSPDKYGLINKSFDFVQPPQKGKIEYVAENRLLKQSDTGEFQVTSGSGKFLFALPPGTKSVRFDDSKLIICNLTAADGPIERCRQAVCDENGKILFTTKGYSVYVFVAGLGDARTTGANGAQRHGVVNLKGEFMIPPQYSYFEVVDADRIIQRAQK
jgi:hypothetical protein